MEISPFTRPRPRASALLLEHCAALGPERERPSPFVRLEALLGADLTRRLLFALAGR